MKPSPAQWQLPDGVSRGLWDYAHNDLVADDYDDYFALHRLFDFDESLAVRELRVRRRSGCVADLGCGTGRALVALCRAGFTGLAIDLSQRMLEIVQEKADIDDLPIECLRANLVQLDAVADQAVDHAVCLFSTLGMIRGERARLQALRHARRILKPGGGFIVHVHNFWFNLYDPSGVRWVVGSLLKAKLDGRFEAGDKYFHYRGVSNMYLHVFRRSELVRQLRSAGFRVDRVIPLARNAAGALPAPAWLPWLRAYGWIAVCTA